MNCTSCQSAKTFYDSVGKCWRCRRCGNSWDASYEVIAERLVSTGQRLSKEEHYTGLLLEQINEMVEDMEGRDDAGQSSDAGNSQGCEGVC